MSNIDEEAKNNFTIEMRIFFYRMNARDVRSLASLCVGSWYALNVCVGKFLCSMFKAFLGNALNTRR
jgi:hypothetical protein